MRKITLLAWLIFQIHLVWAQVPSITSFSPTSGTVGTTVTIAGTNFSTTIANNIVWFGGKRATVTAALATSLTVTVPVGIESNTRLRVLNTVSKRIAESDQVFNLTFPVKPLAVSNYETIVNFTGLLNDGSDAMAVGDLDGDGKPEVVVATDVSATGSLVLYRNTATAGVINASSFNTSVTLNSGNETTGVRMADFNGDGKLDLVVSRRQVAEIGILENQSTGVGNFTFGAMVIIALPTGGGAMVPDVEVADIDGDGKIDIVTGNRIGDNTKLVSVFRNVYTSGAIVAGSFTRADLAGSAQPGALIDVGDLDNDGKPDIIAGNNVGNINIFKNNSTSGTISFAAYVTRNVSSGNSYGTAIADFDGDGKNDIAVATSTPSIDIFRNTNTVSGTLSIPTTPILTLTGLAGTSPTLYVADVDGDGKKDLVYSASTTYFRIFRNTSSGVGNIAFAESIDFNRTTGTGTSVAVADIDGDSFPDLVMANMLLTNLGVQRYKSSYYSRASTNWNVVSTWGATCGGGAGSVLPTSTDNVIICSGTTVTLTANAVCNDLTINSGGTLVTNGFTLDIKGNFTNDGTFTAGTGAVTFTGTTLQTIAGSVSTTFNNLTANNATNIALSTSATVSTTLTFTNGKVILNGTSNLTLSNATVASQISGNTAARYIVTNGTGRLIRGTGGANLLFPVGSLAFYQPITLVNAAANAGVRFGSPTIIVPNSGQGSWYVNNASTTSDITLNNPQGIVQTASLKIFRYNTGSWIQFVGTTYSAPNYTANYAFLGATEEFSISESKAYALAFDGVNDYVTTSPSANLAMTGGQMTFEAWVLTNNNTVTQNFLRLRGGATDTGGEILITNTGFFQINAELGGWQNYVTPFAVSNNTWYHVAMVVSGATMSLYVDGKFVGSQVGAGSLTNTGATAYLQMGKHTTGTDYVNGKMDEVRVWNVARTACQISDNMRTELTGSETGLVAYYKFNEGVAGGTNTGITTLPDLAGTADNGTLNGFALTGTVSNWVDSKVMENFTVTTAAANTITHNTATLNGEITVINGGNATERGFVVSTASCPVIGEPTSIQIIQIGSFGLGTFTGVANLLHNTTYYYRSYAINPNGIVYGNIQTFTTQGFAPFGNALDFDGVDDVVSVPHNATVSFERTNPFTLECWFKTSVSSTKSLISKINTATGVGYELWMNNTNNLHVYLFSSGGSRLEVRTNGVAYNDGIWHHVAVAYDGSSSAANVKIYVDGVQQSLVVVFNTLTTSILNTENVTIGNRANNFQMFNGDIDEVRIWNITRTQAQIQADMYAYITPAHAQYANLRAYYRFDQGNAGADNTALPAEVVDYSSNCNKGTLVNFARTGATSNWVETTNDKAPIVTTTLPTNITSTAATLNGTIINTGEGGITVQGFVYSSTESCPTLANATTLNTGIIAGDYNAATPMLVAGNYYVRAYATNAYGTSYGETRILPINNGFLTIWQTTTANETITIPVASSTTYNCSVNWGDGSVTQNFSGTSPVMSYTYATAGTYIVSITGTFPRIFFNSTGNRLKIKSIEKWGNIAWTSMNNAFAGCNNLQLNATDTPNLSGVVDMSSMFANCFALTTNNSMNSWNTATVNNMSGMFFFATAFNQNISSWNTASVMNMSNMFLEANAFNQNIGSWNTASVTTMNSMFNGATAFNQNISSWNTASVTDMTGMFNNAPNFNQNIGNWNTGAVTSMGIMFNGATNFNQNLGSWNVTNVANFSNMLNSCGMNTANYDATLIGWAAQSVQTSRTLGATGRTYCVGATARQTLVSSKGWTISGDALSGACPAFSAITATNVTTTGFTANWTADATATSYDIEVSTTGTFTGTPTQTGITSTSVVRTATPNTVYYYRVRKGTPVVGAWSNVKAVSTSLPAGSGNLMSFDGTAGKKVEVNNNSTFNFTSANTFTLSAWIKINALGTDMHILSKRTGTQGYALWVNATGNLAVFRDATSSVGTSTLPTNTWVHVAVAFSSGGGFTTYINGVLEATVAGATISATAQNFTIGSRADNSFPFNGQIDEVRIWDITRNQTDIQANMCAKLTGNESGLVGYFRLDEGGTSPTAENKAYTATIDGSLISSPTWNVSGAPLGDVSANTYGGTTLTLTNTDAMAADEFTGSPTGVHLYKVNATPNATSAPIGYNTIHTDRYWGLFFVGGSSPTADLTYTYSTNTNVLIENALRFGKRNDNTVGTWSKNGGIVYNTANTLYQSKETAGEFILCEKNAVIPAVRNGGTVLNLTGSNGVTVANPVSTNFTIEFWMRSSQASTGATHWYNGARLISSTLASNGTQNDYGISVLGGKLAFGIGNTTVISTTSVNTGEWFHVAVQREILGANSILTIILNGGKEIVTSSASTNVSPLTASTNLTIGNRNNTDFYFTGEFDELRFWDTIVDSFDVSNWMNLRANQNHVNIQNLVAYYRFDENTSNTSENLTMGVDATLTNSAMWVLSTQPLADGNFHRLTVNTASQTANFVNAGTTVYFGATVPNGDLVATRLDAVPNNFPAVAGMSFLNSYWVIRNYGTNQTFSFLPEMKFEVPAGNVISPTDLANPNNIKLYKRPDNAVNVGDWIGVARATGFGSIRFAEAFAGGSPTPVSDFSQFVIGSITSPLPITLVGFMGERVNNGTGEATEEILLRWQTAQEINNKGFEVEMSVDGLAYQKIAFVDGKGTSNASINYQLNTINPNEAYYRLKQIDFGGTFSYSPVVFVRGMVGKDFVRVYPNPTQHEFRLKVSENILPTETINIEIYDMVGKCVWRGAGKLAEVEANINHTFTNWKAGTYILHLRTDKKKVQTKFVKE